MSLRRFAWVALSLAAPWPIVAHAQQPLIDAGQQAMIQHYNNLIEQQSTPGQEEEVERVRRARGSEEPMRLEQCDVGALKEKLRPEYERRVQSEGRDAAASWLRQKGNEIGRYARENC